MKPLYLSALIAFLLDQLSKYIILYGVLLPKHQEIMVYPPFLTFRMGWNSGVNFGFLSGGADISRWALVLVAVFVSVWLWMWIYKNQEASRYVKIFVGLLIGGALGNAFDRVLYGAVADFLNMSCCGISNPYVFNVADITIFIGALGLIIFPLPKDKKADTKSPKK